MAERPLDAEERWFVTAARAIGLGAFEYHAADGSVRLDAPICDTLGLPRGTVLSEAEWASAMVADDLSRLQARVLAGDLAEGLARVRGAGGRVIAFAARFKVLRDDAGHMTGAVGVAADASALWDFEVARREQEQRRQQTAVDELDRLNRSLREARDSAEAASRAKSTFLANMSHEIRTPLNAVVGLTYLLERQLTAPPASDQLRKISDAAKHLLRIINEFLDLSKIEAGAVALDTSMFAFDRLVDQAFAMVAERAAQKGLTLSSEVDAALPPLLRGDPLRVCQILLNLVGNAIKFSNQGTVCVRVRVVAEDAESTLVRVEVVDQGIGLTEAAQTRLFQPFAQAHASADLRSDGTGLGLAISRRLAELMGGELGVTSTLGVGSTFYFQARFGHAPASERSPSRISEQRLKALSLERALADRHRGARVLVVDDDATSCHVVRELLSGAGLVVEVAESGLAAIDRVGAGGLALVLMDVEMPDIDGLEATRRIRAIPGVGTLPIIAVSARALVDDRARCLAAGMNDHVGKPIEPGELFSVIVEWMGQAPDASSDAQAGAVPIRGNEQEVLVQRLDASSGSALERLQTLQGLLRADDTRSNALVTEALPELESVLGTVAFAIRDAVNEFDYARALALLEGGRSVDE